jgi:hypothetical protein
VLGRLALVLVVAGSLSAAGVAASTPEQELADKYAPVVALKQQTADCDTNGEPYRPVPADVVLGQRDVDLVDSSGNLLEAAPTAADLFGAGPDDYLDLPGDPLNPGCSYEKWAKKISAGKPTTAYAHIVTERGQLALQYWLYYPFNDWNNKHESDWEMIQLMFNASTVEDALKRAPTEIGFSQHSGAEQAKWDDSKLEKRGVHPIVYPGKGSHANYYSQAVWLGHSAQEGFGCDDTRAPSNLVQTQAVVLPDSPPASATSRFAWLAYEGHWGQKENGPNTGPTGPNMKTQWTEPTTWAEDTWRSSSASVPAGSTFGSSATGFFCTSVAFGSKVYIKFLSQPWVVLSFLGAIALFGMWLSRRTQWRPVVADPVDRARTAGQIYRTGWRLYRRVWPLMLGVGLLFIPFGVLAAVVQGLVLHVTGVGNFVGGLDDVPVMAGIIALGFGQLSTIVATVLVTSAVAEALGQIQEGERPDALIAYRKVLPRADTLGWAWLRIIVVAGLLTITLVGIPVAIVYLVRKSIVTQCCILENLGSTDALRRSSELVRGHGPASSRSPPSST